MGTQEKTLPKFEHSAAASWARVWRFRGVRFLGQDRSFVLPSSFLSKRGIRVIIVITAIIIRTAAILSRLAAEARSASQFHRHRPGGPTRPGDNDALHSAPTRRFHSPFTSTPPQDHPQDHPPCFSVSHRLYSWTSWSDIYPPHGGTLD